MVQERDDNMRDVESVINQRSKEMETKYRQQAEDQVEDIRRTALQARHDFDHESSTVRAR